MAKRPILTTTADGRRPTTTDAGIPVPSDEFSLTIGLDGPLSLRDHQLIEQMANFNQERIFERQPHAKGSGAFGCFEAQGTSANIPRPRRSSRAPRRTCWCASQPSPASAAAPTRGATREGSR
jgi:hypothetical protein